MPSRPTELPRRAAGWLAPAALLALAPKCILCVLAYAGLGAAFGLGGPEFCDGSETSSASWTTLLAWFGGILALATGACVATCRKPQRDHPSLAPAWRPGLGRFTPRVRRVATPGKTA